MSKNTYPLTIRKLSSLNFFFAPAFWGFLVLNIPSIKILFFSQAVNVIAIVGLYLSYFLKTSKIKVDKTRIKCFVIMCLFWGILFLYGIFGTQAVVDTELFLRYISVYIAIVGLVFFITEKDVPKIVFWQIFWGTSLSIYQIFYGVSYVNYSNEQIQYNTVAIPLTSSLLAILGLLFFSKNITNNILIKVVLCVCVIFNLIGLTTLEGRRHFIFVLLIVLIFTLSKYNFLVVFKSKKLSNLLKISVSVAVIAWIVIYNLQSRLNEFALYRYYRLFNEIDEEPRIQLYKSSIEAIISNPFGYGLNASETVIGYYPHNIFLEILISGGIFCLIVFLIFVILFFKKVKVATTNSSYQNSFAMISFYLFLVWNVGWDLASSYMCLGSMAITICTTKNNNYKTNKILNFSKVYDTKLK